MTSKFKLLMTTNVKNEIWDYSVILAGALLKQIDAEILMLSFGGEPTINQKAEAESLNVKFLFSDFSPAIFNDSEAKSLFESTVKEFNPHILHLNDCYINSDFKKPGIFTFHNDLLNKKLCNFGINNINNYNYQDNNFLKQKELINKSLNNADIIITQSRVPAEYLIKTYDLQKKIKIVYNGIDYKPYSGMRENINLLAHGNLSDRSKNISLLLNMAYKLPDNIKLKIIGDFPPERRLPRNVEFLNNLSGEELMNVYKTSSIYIAASSYESNGISSMQAAFSGCAVLAADIPVFKELWGDCACMFEKENLNSLMKTVNNLAENRNLLEITSRNCQAKALSVYNSKRMASEYINLYKNILRQYYTAEKISRENLKPVSRDSGN